jgi:LysR family hydrogen peroxide-inducible transcriptional activator
MNLPTLRQLRYLTSVVSLKHFGRAAEQCFVTQSTLSAGIQDLEKLLGAKLLERTNRKVLVTELGEEVCQRAQQILSLSADLVDVAQLENNPLSGRIRMGVIPSISPFLLPKSLANIRRQLPQIELLLIEEQSDRLVKKLNDGEIDLAILAFPFDIGRLEYSIFASESFWVAMPKDHPLTATTSVNASELPIDDLLLLTEGHCLREHALTACNLPTTRHRTSMQGTSLYTLVEMVAGGLGITLIPEMAIKSEMVTHADITLRPLVAQEKPTREIGLVWRSSYRATTSIELLCEHFAAALNTHTI